MLKKLRKMYPHQTLLMFFILGLIISAGSFVVQYGFKVEPCEMCYWQRYLAWTITAVAFIGTLFRGKIKKVFLAIISLVAFTSMTIGGWQSLSQMGYVELPTACQAPEAQEVEKTGEELLAAIENNQTGYVDCSQPETGFFLYEYTGITLANLNTVLMLLVGVFAFYKLFFKPKRRFRKFNKYKRYNNNRKGGNNNNHKRRYRGSGYQRSNSRNRKYDNKND